jgi:EAL domain-containing protein (putative c-di-GMP-specific phosphodiesterase class I)/GGDEF domain-containing protein
VELALPHIVIWTRGPGVGTDLVAALAAHPVEISEVRGLIEARRAASGPPPTLVVLVCPVDVRARVRDAAAEFPKVSILVLRDAPARSEPDVPGDSDTFAERPVAASLDELCWHVMEALSRTRPRTDAPEHRLGPVQLALDRAGVITGGHTLQSSWFFPGPFPETGDSILPLTDPLDRDGLMRHLDRADPDLPAFFPMRVMDPRGSSHPTHAALRATGPDSALLILQPLIDAAPIVGRRRGTRDPLTGLIDRWELWRRMEEEGAGGGPAFVLHPRLDTFASIAENLSFEQVDEVFDRVASAILQVFPWPAQPSRLTGGAFLLLVKEASEQLVVQQAMRLIRKVNRILLPGLSGRTPLGLSIGIAAVTAGDHDLAVRLAETAAREAHAAGGNRVVVAGPPTLIRCRLQDLSANIAEESWDVWLQPVARGVERVPEFHEALARFGSGPPPRISRPEFFATCQAAGLLEQFDRLMFIRSLDLLRAFPKLRLSVNVTHGTFVLPSFPESFLGLLREARVAAERIIIEISPACLTLPPDLAGARLGRLEAEGVRTALDDFGSGICSLRHLTDYPLGMVKLDELVTGYVADDPLQRNFVRMVVNLCRARGIRIVAEYTRTATQLERLDEDGVELFQGELLGMPRPAAELFVAPPPEPRR